MRLAQDIDTGEWRTWAGQAVSTLSLRRRDRLTIEMRFTRAGLPIELATGATGKLGMKADATDADFVALASSFVKTGTGAQAVYSFDLNLNMTEMEALFSADPATVSVVAECETLQGTKRISSQTLSVTVSNDVIHGDEGVPQSAGTKRAKTAIVDESDLVEVEFDAAFPSASWHFVGAPVISNTVDATPLGIFIVGLVARTAAGFTVALSAPVDSSNYKLEWVAALD